MSNETKHARAAIEAVQSLRDKQAIQDAAPELLAVCKMVLDLDTSPEGMADAWSELYDAADAAVAKAERRLP